MQIFPWSFCSISGKGTSFPPSMSCTNIPHPLLKKIPEWGNTSPRAGNYIMPRHIPRRWWYVHGIKLQDQPVTFCPSLSQITPDLGRTHSKAQRNQLFPFQKREDGITCVKLRSEQPPKNFTASYNFMCRSNMPTVVKSCIIIFAWQVGNW